MVNIPSDNSVSSAVFIVCLSLMRVQLILTWYLLPPFFCSHPTFGCVLLCSSAARYSNLGVARGRGYSIGSVEHTVSSSYCSLLCNDEFKGCLEVRYQFVGAICRMPDILMFSVAHAKC